MKPFRVKVRIGNNRLITAREQLGLSQAECARRIGISNGALNELECLRRSAHRAREQSGSVELLPEWTEVALAIAAFHGLSPDYLWPEEVRAVRANKFELAAHAEELVALPTSPSLALETSELKAAARVALKTLTLREEKVLRMRFGIGEKGEHTLEEVGRAFFSPSEMETQPARQWAIRIEQKALRKLRHTDRAKLLSGFAVDGEP